MIGQFQASTALPSGKEPLYPLYRKICGPQGRSALDSEERMPADVHLDTPATLPLGKKLPVPDEQGAA